MNNRNTFEVERQRAQSLLILEAIKSGAGPDAVCKNLTFFVDLRLIDDSSRAISDRCKSKPKGVPALPPTPSSGGYGLQPFGESAFGGIAGSGLPLDGYASDADTGLPLPDARVTVGRAPAVKTDLLGHFPMPHLPEGTELDVTVEKSGYETAKMRVKVGSIFNIGLHHKISPTKQ